MKPKHNKIFPNGPFLCLVIGGSGKGKTHFVYDILTSKDFLDFNNLIIYTNKPRIKYYYFLKHGFDNNIKKELLFNALRAYEIREDTGEYELKDIERIVKSIAEDNKDNISKSIIKVRLAKNLNYDDIPKNDKTIVVFDDCINDGNQDLQREIFISGRGDQKGAIYITQSFTELDPIIKRNASCCAMFDLDEYDLTNINRRFNTGMDNRTFRNHCKKIWEDDQYKHIYINPILTRGERVKTKIIIEPLDTDSEDEI